MKKIGKIAQSIPVFCEQWGLYATIYDDVLLPYAKECHKYERNADPEFVLYKINQYCKGLPTPTEISIAVLYTISSSIAAILSPEKRIFDLYAFFEQFILSHGKECTISTSYDYRDQAFIIRDALMRLIMEKQVTTIIPE